MKFYDDLSIEGCVDELKKVRDDIKALQAKETELKERILADGRDEIKGEKHIMKISVRNKETFNNEAFIEQFSKDKNFDDDLKAEIIQMKPVLNEANLSQAVKDEKIPLDYIIPFNSVVSSKTILVK